MKFVLQYIIFIHKLLFGKVFWERWLHIFVNPREQFENVSLTFFNIFISIILTGELICSIKLVITLSL